MVTIQLNLSLHQLLCDQKFALVHTHSIYQATTLIMKLGRTPISMNWKSNFNMLLTLTPMRMSIPKVGQLDSATKARSTTG